MSSRNKPIYPSISSSKPQLLGQEKPKENNKLLIIGTVVILIGFVLIILIKMDIISFSSSSSSSTNCIVSNWSDCINNQRIRTIKQATNGGVACTPAQNALPLTQSCNDCKVELGCY